LSGLDLERTDPEEGQSQFTSPVFQGIPGTFSRVIDCFDCRIPSLVPRSSLQGQICEVLRELFRPSEFSEVRGPSFRALQIFSEPFFLQLTCRTSTHFTSSVGHLQLIPMDGYLVKRTSEFLVSVVTWPSRGVGTLEFPATFPPSQCVHWGTLRVQVGTFRVDVGLFCHSLPLLAVREAEGGGFEAQLFSTRVYPLPCEQ
jgi:hypothetical protein